ncbi:cell division control protein Cdc6 [Pyrodictium delaneyi]|uniref:ORC1-type DNA replication protein n=1 Tax=Pyrodictium delaneyi TaxID=1273541 RepID=A0A0P0N510_9CREN|nr:cell division control protein Cdc6 [Pyrodictium delaneyi]OWJ55206.1 cell division control protein Cdc6 [Pyrodictium delaneyi]
MEDILDEIFERVVESRIFRNRDILSPDYIPEKLPHRENEIRKVGSVLAQALKNSRPNNLFIYGLTGTGKTAVTLYVLRRLEAKARQLGVDVRYAYVNTRQRDTPYKVLADIASSIGLRVPFTGLSTAEVYTRLVRALSRRSGVLIVVLDEVDWLVRRKGDDILYKLTRIGYELPAGSTKVSIVGITNDVKFVEMLDARVRSSLGEEEVVFPPYNAEQLRDILWERAREAFQPGAVDEAVISYCAALAAREHGDARRALDLLRVAGEMAERENAPRVTVEHVKKAWMQLERDRVYEVVSTLPLHARLVLLAVIKAAGTGYTTTGELYTVYRELASRIGVESVTQRRISDIINELDMLGILSARVVSRGRYGKTRMISLAADPGTIIEALARDTRLRQLLEDAPLPPKREQLIGSAGA